jgi:hypothetical protein
MGRPSKFTAPTRERILEAKRVGASDRTAARVAGIGPTTLKDWLARGRDGKADSAYARFYAEFEEASAHPRERALGIIYNALPDRPDLAWKYIERREDGYSPPITQAPPAPQLVNLTLSFFEQGPTSEVTVGLAESAPSGPAELEAGAS